MTFISSYNKAVEILSAIGDGKCKGTCKTTWLRNLRYALKTKTNPLGLNKKQRKNMTEKLKSVSGRKQQQHSTTLKKYKNRKSPPYPANEYCNQVMKGNDGNEYISKPNKNNVCSWKKV